MAANRVAMRKCREILRLKLVEGMSNRAVAEVTGVGAATVSRVWVRARLRELSWTRVEALADTELNALICGGAPSSSERPAPDWPSSSLAGLLALLFLTNSTAASPSRTATSRRHSERTKSLPVTTARRSCQRVRTFARGVLASLRMRLQKRTETPGDYRSPP